MIMATHSLIDLSVVPHAACGTGAGGAPAARRRGRPTSYTPELGQVIANRITEGESLRRICANASLPHISTVLRWAADPNHEFRDQYARAREVQAHVFVDRIIEISDACIEGRIGPREARVAIDTLKWFASRMAPRWYGTQINVESTPAAVEKLRDSDLAALASQLIGRDR